MLFKLLKLFGLDVRAEIAAVKGVITRRFDDVTDRARHLAIGAAVIAVLAMFAGLFFVAASFQLAVCSADWKSAATGCNSTTT